MRTILAALLLAGAAACGCPDPDDPICDENARSEEGDCGRVVKACIKSCAFANDYRRYVDARCRGGVQVCPSGTVPVDSCDD